MYIIYFNSIINIYTSVLSYNMYNLYARIKIESLLHLQILTIDISKGPVRPVNRADEAAFTRFCGQQLTR
jgi:hypothetical protein